MGVRRNNGGFCRRRKGEDSLNSPGYSQMGRELWTVYPSESTAYYWIDTPLGKWLWRRGIHLKRIRYGLVGCGRIAANHLKAACACEGIEVAALCDLAPSKGEDLAEKFSLHPVVYRDY